MEGARKILFITEKTQFTSQLNAYTLPDGLGLQAVQITGENLIDQIKAEIVNWGSVCCSIKVFSVKVFFCICYG